MGDGVPTARRAGGRDTRGARARALTCAGNSAEAAAATAAATGSQADESNQVLALAREKPQATAADVLIYPGRRRCACALGAGSSAQARRALGGRAGVGSVGAGAARRDPASRGRRPGGAGVGGSRRTALPLVPLFSCSLLSQLCPVPQGEPPLGDPGPGWLPSWGLGEGTGSRSESGRVLSAWTDDSDFLPHLLAASPLTTVLQSPRPPS